MADKVLRMKSGESDHTFFKPANRSDIQRKCADCEEEKKLCRGKKFLPEVTIQNMKPDISLMSLIQAETVYPKRQKFF